MKQSRDSRKASDAPIFPKKSERSNQEIVESVSISKVSFSKSLVVQKQSRDSRKQGVNAGYPKARAEKQSRDSRKR